MGKNSQRRAAAREAELLAKRRALEEQFGITITPSKPELGGRFLSVVNSWPAIRYPRAKGLRRG